MKINSKLKSKKFNQNLFRQIEALEGKIKAGYPKESKETFEEDLNGHTPLFKATEINFSEKNYIPYLQIVWEDNKIKYKKKFASIARQPLKKQPKLLDSLGGEMVKDIRQTLFNIQVAPQDKRGCIYGSITFVRIN